MKTRLVKCECPECGYVARVTRKWLAVGRPICPVDKVNMLAVWSDDAES